MTRYCLLVVVQLMFVASHAVAEETVALNTSNTPPYSNDAGTGFQDLLVREAFRRIGVQVRFFHVQPERALVNVNRGIDDGNLIRVSGLMGAYPNIRQVPEELFSYEFVVFSKRGLFQPKDWKSLRPYRIAFIRGWKILEKNVSEARSITKTTDERELFELLRSGKVDAVIHERWRGRHMIKVMGLEGFEALEPALTQRKMFIYMHKRHEALIPNIADALKSMKKDGTYDEIFNRTLRPDMTQ